MKRVIEGLGNAGRIPIAVQAWVDPNVFGTKADEYRAVLNETPCDIEKINLNIPQDIRRSGRRSIVPVAQF